MEKWEKRTLIGGIGSWIVFFSGGALVWRLLPGILFPFFIISALIIEQFSIKYDNNAYYQALSHTRIEMVKEYIEDGASLDAIKVRGVDSKNESPLSIALGHHSSPLPRILLEMGADPNSSNLGGLTLLMSVCGADVDGAWRIWPDLEYCKLLVEFGADINPRDIHGMTALDYAIKLRDNEIAYYLIDIGAEIKPQTVEKLWEDTKDTQYAVMQRLCMELFARGMEIPLSPIATAVILGDSAEVNRLAAEGEIGDDLTLITYYAAAFCSSDTVNFLFDSGFDKNVKDTGQKLMNIAAMYGNIDIMNYLLDNGFEWTECTSRSESTFLLAAQFDQIEVVRFLLERGADFSNLAITSYNDLMKTPLSSASKNGNLEMIKLLHDNRYPLTDADVRNATKAAINNRHTNVLEYLAEICDGDTTLMSEITEGFDDACRYGDIDILKFFIDLGVDPNGDNKNGYPIKRAVDSSDTQKVKYLLSIGADVDGLFNATENCDFEMVQFLVENGANIDTIVGEELTTVTLEAAGLSNHILKYYIEQGADIDYQDAKGETALMKAVRNNRLINARLLLNSGANKALINNSGQTALNIAKQNEYKEIVAVLEK